MKCTLHGVGLGLMVLSASVAPARAQDSAIPTDGLELWVKADGPMTLTNSQITQWTDLSGKANHAIHDAFGQTTPTLATANGQPTLRFSGVYTGFHFTQITTIRTVFAVLSKVSSSCLPTLPNYGTSAKFWLGGNANPTYFHPEHGCCIYNSNLSEVSPNLVNGKTYLNGKLVDGRTTQFPLDQLGLLSIVALANVSADTIARDRNFQDRSWQGDISELLIYSKALDDATRLSIQDILTKKYAIGAAGDGGTSGGAADAPPPGAGGAGGGAGTGGAAGTSGATGHTGGAADAAPDGAGDATRSGGTGGAGGTDAATGRTGGVDAAAGGTGAAGVSGTAGGAGGASAATGISGTAGHTGGTVDTASGGATAAAGGSGIGGTLGSGSPGGLTAASGATSARGATGTGEVTTTGGAVGGTAGGTSPSLNQAGRSSGCSCRVARKGDSRASGLAVLLLVVFAPLLRARRR